MSSLLIISHTNHYYDNNGKVRGWEPTVREINYLSHIFDKIIHIAPLYKDNPHKATLSYSTNRISFVPIIPAGGSGIINKLSILFYMPYNLFKIYQYINQVEWVHFRAPTSMGLYVLPLLSIYKNKKMWFKYAGNWNQKFPPCSYKLQKWWLNNNNSKVTINGSWPNQRSHLLSFENPCINEDEYEKAKFYRSKKKYNKKLNLCFVGRLESEKGILIICELLKNLVDIDSFDTFFIVGDGPLKASLDKQVKNSKINVCITGSLSRDELNEIYIKSHIFIFPSYASEGFPKVLAEAALFGCIPIVNNISSIGQYIKNNYSGIIIDNLTAINIESILLELLNNRKKLSSISKSLTDWATLFTYNRYIQRIKEEIIHG